MIIAGKHNLLGIQIDAVDYEGAVEQIVHAAKQGKPFAVSAMAVHGTMTGALDREHKFRLNRFDLLVPDGQPVRWALNLLYRTGLSDRVYGPQLTLNLLEAAEQDALPVYFYGGTAEICEALDIRLKERFPELKIAGIEASKFRPITEEERDDLVRRVAQSKAQMVFVGIGCPRQEVWAYELRERLSAPVIAVGAAFPFIAGTLAQAPSWLQRYGLEWLFRLIHEPRRLWRRYLFLNPLYIAMVVLQAFGVTFQPDGTRPTRELLFG